MVSYLDGFWIWIWFWLPLFHLWLPHLTSPHTTPSFPFPVHPWLMSTARYGTHTRNGQGGGHSDLGVVISGPSFGGVRLCRGWQRGVRYPGGVVGRRRVSEGVAFFRVCLLCVSVSLTRTAASGGGEQTALFCCCLGFLFLLLGFADRRQWMGWLGTERDSMLAAITD